MVAPRFARLRPGPVPPGSDASAVPDDGMCLSCFLVVRSRERPGEVLLGRVDPAAPWREVGGLGPERLVSIGDRWMLPASQLLLLESPDDAARRLARDLVGHALADPGAPRVFSETSERAGGGGRDPHWDLHYLYEIDWQGPPPPRVGCGGSSRSGRSDRWRPASSPGTTTTCSR